MNVQATPPNVETLECLTQRVLQLERKVAAGCDANRLTMIVFSGELDKLLAAFVIATGAAACGMDVSMFFTFWGTAALKKAGPQACGKTICEKMLGWMLPGGLHKPKLSKRNLAGLGRGMLVREMKKKNAPDLPSLIEIARQSAVEISICEMSMSLMGIKPSELIDYPGIQFVGVACFLDKSSKAGTTLFI